MNDEKLTICPFCKETEFDLIGLKLHLMLYCDEYKTLDVYQGYKKNEQ